MWNFGYNAAFNLGDASYWVIFRVSAPNIYVGMPSLHWWTIGNDGTCDNRVNNMGAVMSCTSPWMQDYVVYALGRARELGYPTGELLKWIAPNLIQQVLDPSFNPYLLGAYRVPTADANGNLFTNWAAVKSGYLLAVQSETDFYPGVVWLGAQNDPDGNVQPAAVAVSMVADQSNGGPAWQWMVNHVEPAVTGDLKWAILPRAISP
jgi:hypothetical protein